MKNIVLISGHLFESQRRAGFHLIAESLGNVGHNVVFMTAPYSKLFRLKRHYFNDFQVIKNRLIPQGRNILSYVHSTPFHISNFRNDILNALTSKFYLIYQAFPFSAQMKEKIAQADVIIFESTPGLFLFDTLKKINARAKFIYRVSDDLELLGAHPSLIGYEERVFPRFDLISVPSRFIYDKIKGKQTGGGGRLKLQYHGIDKSLYDREYDSPYQKGGIHAVFIGISRLDYDFLREASVLRKDIMFHIIGPIEPKVIGPNIKYYGEMPFKETIPYVKHANIGMHTLAYSIGAESFSDSLKVHQYTYCGLPIIAPTYLRTKRRNSFYYTLDSSKSIERAIDQCLTYSSNSQDLKEQVLTWEQLTNEMLDVG